MTAGRPTTDHAISGDTTPEKTPHLAPAWKPGQSGNPAGRPKGARHKLGTQFLEDLLADFAEHGKKAIADMRSKDVTAYCKTVASVLPKEVEAGEQTIGILAEILERIDGRTRTIITPKNEQDRPTVQ